MDKCFYNIDMMCVINGSKGSTASSTTLSIQKSER